MNKFVNREDYLKAMDHFIAHFEIAEHYLPAIAIDIQGSMLLDGQVNSASIIITIMADGSNSVTGKFGELLAILDNRDEKWNTLMGKVSSLDITLGDYSYTVKPAVISNRGNISLQQVRDVLFHSAIAEGILAHLLINWITNPVSYDIDRINYYIDVYTTQLASRSSASAFMSNNPSRTIEELLLTTALISKYLPSERKINYSKLISFDPADLV